MANETPDAVLALLPTLLQGAEKTFENAEQLFREAQLLAEGGAVARALCLHQISLEECSKVDSLGAWATSLVLGFEVDQKKVFAALSRHASKNRLNAYMLDLSDAEAEARERGDLKAASELFKQSQTQFHASSNNAKNASLYVDWVDGAFVAPADRITTVMLEEVTKRNATFLGFAFNNLKALRRLTAAPHEMREPLLGFVKQAEQLLEQAPADFAKAMDALLSTLLDYQPHSLQSGDAESGKP